MALFRAEQALTEINLKKTPKDKIDCVLACGKHLFNAIVSLGMSADDLLPLFTMALLLANPPQLRSNIEFIQHYRNAAKLKSEAGYVLVQLETAIYFLENVDHDQLNGVSEAEFELMTSDAAGADAGEADAEAQAEVDAEEAAAAAELQAILELQEVDIVPSIRISEELALDPGDGDLLQWLSEASNSEEGLGRCTSPGEESEERNSAADKSSTVSEAVPTLTIDETETPAELVSEDDELAAKKKVKKKKKKPDAADERGESGDGKVKKKKKAKDKEKEKVKEKKVKEKAKEKAKEKKEEQLAESHGETTLETAAPLQPVLEESSEEASAGVREVHTVVVTPAPTIHAPVAVSPSPATEVISPRRRGTPLSGGLKDHRRISRRPSNGLFVKKEDTKGKHRSVSIQEAQSHVIRMRDMHEFHKVFSSTKQLEVDSDDLLNPVLRATVIAQHEAQSWAEISLRVGQLVLVTTHKGGVLDIAGILRKGWWNGELGGCSGWFPRRYVAALSRRRSRLTIASCVEVLEEPTSNKQFVDAGYKSLMNLPTQQDWDVLLDKSSVQLFNEGDVISHVVGYSPFLAVCWHYGALTSTGRPLPASVPGTKGPVQDGNSDDDRDRGHVLSSHGAGRGSRDLRGAGIAPWR